jgi:hypothetical protein
MCSGAQLYSLAKTPQPSPPPHLGSFTRALLVAQDRWHLFVTPMPSFRFNTYSFLATHFWEYTHFVKLLETEKENTFSKKMRLFKKEKTTVVEKGEKGESLIKLIWFADSWEARIRHHRKLEDRDGDIREDYVRYTRYRKLDKINPLPVKKRV